MVHWGQVSLDLSDLLTLVSPLAVLAAAFVAVGVLRARVQDHERRINALEAGVAAERKDRETAHKELSERVRLNERWIDRRRGEAAARGQRRRSPPLGVPRAGTGEYRSPDES